MKLIVNRVTLNMCFSFIVFVNYDFKINVITALNLIKYKLVF